MTQAPGATAEAPATGDQAGRRAPTRKVGVVISDKRRKTRTVAVDFSFKHAKYGKFITRQHKYHVHDEDDASKNGDRVEISPCRPLSKTKSWTLVRIVEAAPEAVTHKTASEDEQIEESNPDQETQPAAEAV